MGNCADGEQLTEEERKQRAKEKKLSSEVDGKLEKERREDFSFIKLLLLGAGESGKSTIFKQMTTIYGSGFSESERAAYAPIIFNNTITAMKTLMDNCEKYGELSKSVEDSKAYINEVRDDKKIDSELAKHIENLWADPLVKLTFENRSKFQIAESADYFFQKIHALAEKNYVPSYQDMLRARVRTTGIGEMQFEIDHTKFKMFDVGGQRNERKKWIHCFEHVTAVLFVAAISEYDQMLYEDEKMNRMIEALNLFSEICNSRWFRKTSMILFLNKRDLFAEKIKKVPLTVCFPEYNEENDYDHASVFIRKQFEQRKKNQQKTIYSHLTCATDTDNVTMVFNAVRDIIIRQSLKADGLLM